MRQRHVQGMQGTSLSRINFNSNNHYKTDSYVLSRTLARNYYPSMRQVYRACTVSVLMITHVHTHEWCIYKRPIHTAANCDIAELFQTCSE